MTQDVSEDLAGLLSDLREISNTHPNGRLRIGMDEVRLIVSALSALQSERAARLRVEAALERERLAPIIDPHAWALWPDGADKPGDTRAGQKRVRADSLAKADLIRAEALGDGGAEA